MSFDIVLELRRCGQLLMWSLGLIWGRLVSFSIWSGTLGT